MTESSASAFSASDQSLLQLHDGRVCLDKRDVHVWLGCQDQFSTSDAFLRRVLSHYAAVNPAQWQFARGEHGKPALVDAPRELAFNLSHSGTRLACAVTAGTSVGVDLEHCHTARDVMRLARRFFCADEITALEDCDTAVQRDRFYDYWTLKEAAVKCRGERLAAGLDSRGFTLEFEGDFAALGGRIAVKSTDRVDKASYCLLDPFPEYRLAICCLNGIHGLPQLQLCELSAIGKASLLNVPLRASTWHK